MTVSDYIVSGMTCDHCVRAVTSEVSSVPGVSEVQVSLDDGSLRVTSDAPVPFEQIKATAASPPPC